MTLPIIKAITFSSLLLSSWEGGAISSLAFAFAPPASTTTSRTAAPRDARVVATRVSSSSSSSSSLEDGEVVVGDVGGRRSFLSSSAAAWASAVVVGCGSAPAAAVVAASSSTADYAAVAKDIAAIVRKDPSKGPTLVRLAWHSSGTYDKMSKDGGSGKGTIRFKEELAHGGNAGLQKTAVSWLEAVKRKYGESISYADLYTLGGVVAIRELGGPTIPWSSGRVDALDPSAVTPDGRLPNADSGPPGTDPSDSAHLRAVFYRMGFDDREIVALSGAHALGRCHTTASGYDGPWTPTPTTFSNLYFTFLKQVNWTRRDWSGPFQYEDGSKKFMMLPTDLALIKDSKFKKYVDIYAKDQATFFADFSKAFKKLEELGTANLKATEWA